MQMGSQHFRNTLSYIQTKQRQATDRLNDEEVEGEEGEIAKEVDWEAVDVVGGCLKMGIRR